MPVARAGWPALFGGPGVHRLLHSDTYMNAWLSVLHDCLICSWLIEGHGALPKLIPYSGSLPFCATSQRDMRSHFGWHGLQLLWSDCCRVSRTTQ